MISYPFQNLSYNEVIGPIEPSPIRLFLNISSQAQVKESCRKNVY